MAKRNRVREAQPRKDITCEQCQLRGVIGGDVFPYLVTAVPPVHRWMHQRCAEEFRVQRGAQQLLEAVADCTPKAPAGSGDRSQDVAEKPLMKRRVAQGR